MTTMGIVRPSPLVVPSLHVTEPPSVLRDYAFIGDGRRGALVDPDGGIAWLCFPTWSDPALFASLLGGRGTFHVSPVGRRVHGGYYEEGTLIWRQRWVTDDGVVECREALSYPGERDRCVILRRITAVDGDARIRIRLDVAREYGRAAGGPWRRDWQGWRSEGGGIRARLSGLPEAASAARGVASGLEFALHLHSTESVDLVLELQLDDRARAVAPTPEAAELWRRTEAAWDAAVPPCHGTPAKRDVRQSIAVLRGMTDPDGATVAAASTALPERAEAGRNYDYRYAWVRDTCYIGQAGAAVDGAEPMLTDAVRWVSGRILADGPDTRPAYRPDGRPVPETEHLGLPGYPGGSDIVGNDVRHQFQLDLFGEALLLFARAASRDLLDADGWRAAEIALRAIEANAERPDAGVWEIEPSEWTHSRLICVAGLKAMAEVGAPMRWRTDAQGLADHLLSQADRTSLHPSGRWQRAPDDERVDASLLLAEIRGALPPDDPRSVATRTAIAAELCEDEFLYRFAENGQDLGDARGRLSHLQLLDVPRLPRGRVPDRGSAVVRACPQLVQREWAVLRGVRRRPTTTPRQHPAGLRACAADRVCRAAPRCLRHPTRPSRRCRRAPSRSRPISRRATGPWPGTQRPSSRRRWWRAVRRGSGGRTRPRRAERSFWGSSTTSWSVVT